MSWNKKLLHWTFTEWEVKQLQTALQVSGLPDGVGWMVYSEEQTSKSARSHLQGVLVLNEPQTLRWVRHSVSMTAHFEQMKKPLLASLRYCTKDLTHVAGPFYLGITKEYVDSLLEQELARYIGWCEGHPIRTKLSKADIVPPKKNK